MKILLGTSNKHKILEINDILKHLNLSIEVITLNDMPIKYQEPTENGSTYLENALIKAKYYYEKYQLPVITDDTGLEVETLNGKPGIYSSRYAGDGKYATSSSDNRKKLLNDLQGETNRKALFKCVMVYYDGESMVVGNGQMDGEILNVEVGNNGFGYDSLFYLPRYGCSVSELGENEKNKISHRFFALVNLIDNLTKKGIFLV